VVNAGQMPNTCRRRSERDPVTLAGSAFGFARSRSVIISDLSQEGAQLDARDLPPAGEDLCLVVGAFDTMARVAWKAGDKCGVEFDEALSGEIMAQLKRDAEWVQVAGWYR
jgi:hypothetical protein